MRFTPFLPMGLMMLTISCSQQDLASIQGSIHCSEGMQSDTIYVALFHDAINAYNNMGSPIEFRSQTSPSFSFNVKPGKYGIAVFTYTSEVYRGHLYLPNSSFKLEMDIELTPLGLPASMDTVSVVGLFSGWQQYEGMRMVRDGNSYVLKKPDQLKAGDEYAFYINNKKVHDPTHPLEYLSKEWCNFNHYYKGGEIRFNPDHYQQPFSEPTAAMNHEKLQQDYYEVSIALNQLDGTARSLMQLIYSPNPVVNMALWETLSSDMKKSIETLEAQYPDFDQLILERRIMNEALLHPFQFDLKRLYMQSRLDSAEMASIMNGASFREYVEKMLTYSKQLDPRSFLLNGHFVNEFSSLDYRLKNASELVGELGLNESYFLDFVLNFAEQTINGPCAANILFSASYRLIRQNPQKAKQILTQLIDQYPDSEPVQRGWAAKQLQGLNMIDGSQAPDFAVQTLTGDSVRLSDHRGHFVFVDFWGSWCGPCRGEVPNMKKLTAAIPSSRLYFIGLANDDEKALKAFIKKEQIPYANALVPESVLKAYGINAFPTTFLIDPEGRILAKNLRGESLVEQVKTKMDAYLKQ